MSRWLLVTTIVAALFATSADALADVRQAALDDPRDTPQDVNGNYNHPDVQQVRVLYDTAGTVRVTVRLYDPVPQYGSPLSLGLRSHVGACSPSSTYDATVSMRLQRAPSNESITIQGLEGSIPLQQSVSDDGYEVTWEATHQALADRAYKCVTSGRVADGTSAADSTPEFLLVGPGAYRAEPFPAPACSADYEAAHKDFPFTLRNLPAKLAYGRKVEFDMSGPFFADLHPDWQTVEPSFLAIQHGDGKRPFLDDV